MKMHTRRHWLLLAAICAAGSATCKQTGGAATTVNETNPSLSPRFIKLGLEIPGIRIVRFFPGTPAGPDEACLQIGWFQSGKTFPIDDMEQLKGMVSVLDETDALRFVRLRTAPAICYAWPTPEVEIVSEETYRRLPNYGIAGQRTMFGGIGSSRGVYGVLSPRAFAAGKFAPATVRREGTGFRIVRWLYAESLPNRDGGPKDTVMRVSEYVGTDGTYRRSMLAKMPPPRLPGARLQLPRLQ